MTLDLLGFIALSIIAIVSAVMMIASRHAVYSALFLVLNFATIAVLYLLLNAPFIALVQITVYAGAIMVLFLFVIMLLGVERVEESPGLPYQGPVAIGLGFALVLLFGFALLPRGEGAMGQIAEGFGSPAAVGRLLFDRYLVPFEITSVLLLVAMVGAIYLAGVPSRKEAE